MTEGNGRVQWAASSATYSGDLGSPMTFVRMTNEAEARQMVAGTQSLARIDGAALTIVRVEFVNEAPAAVQPSRGPWPDAVPFVYIPNPFTAKRESLGPDHDWADRVRELEELYDEATCVPFPPGSGHVPFGVGPALWSVVHFDFLGRLQAKPIRFPSEEAARVHAESVVRGNGPAAHPVGVARSEFVPYGPPIDASRGPIKNPVTKQIDEFVEATGLPRSSHPNASLEGFVQEAVDRLRYE